LARAYTTSRHSWFGHFGHETWVQFKIVDVTIKELGSSGSFFVGVPVFEIVVGLQVEVFTEFKPKG
jgi:hypothetical protein